MTTHPAPAAKTTGTPRRLALAALALGAGLTGAVTTGSPAVAAPDPTTTPAFGAAPYLVRDALGGPGDGATWIASTTLDAAVLNGRAFYTGSDGAHGQELWVSDGSRAGTRMVRDLAPGAEDSRPDHFVTMAGKVYFTALVDGNDELWVTNGTAVGTHRVTDLGGSGVSANPTRLTIANGRLWFAATATGPDGQQIGTELHVSDGTAGGTHLVGDINPSGSSNPSDVVALAGGRVAFLAENPAVGRELWTSDGTPAGTALRINHNGSPSSSVAGPLVRLANGTVLYVANDGGGARLWRTDGSAIGTSAVTAPGAVGDPQNLKAVGNQLYFSGTTAGTGHELFRSDGTAAGTTLVADLVPGTGSSGFSSPGVVAGTLWFKAATPTGGTAVWSLRPGDVPRQRAVLTTDSSGAFLPGFAGVNGRVVFSADLPNGRGTELYTIEGNGLRLLADLNGTGASTPSLPIALGATALYTASSYTRGRELFAWNTQPTTSRLTANRRYTARQAARRSIRVRVTVKGGSLPVSGPVQVRDGARVVGTGRVVKGAGTVRITKRLATGGHRLSVRFGGGTNGRSSTSRVVRVTVLRAG